MKFHTTCMSQSHIMCLYGVKARPIIYLFFFFPVLICEENNNATGPPHTKQKTIQGNLE